MSEIHSFSEFTGRLSKRDAILTHISPCLQRRRSEIIGNLVRNWNSSPSIRTMSALGCLYGCRAAPYWSKNLRNLQKKQSSQRAINALEHRTWQGKACTS